MKSILLVAAASLCLAFTASAQEVSEGKELAKTSFDSVDQNGNGLIDMGESENFGGDVFVSMDYDENKRLSEEEFLNWDYGFVVLAEETDKELAYRTALVVVFSFWDRDGDGEISRAEHRQAVARDFENADLDGDLFLNEAEFFGGFSIMTAIRAALKPIEE